MQTDDRAHLLAGCSNEVKPVEIGRWFAVHCCKKPKSVISIGCCFLAIFIHFSSTDLRVGICVHQFIILTLTDVNV